jgi:hypothetical protein
MLLLARIFPSMCVHHLDQNQGSEAERQSDTLHQKRERRSVAHKRLAASCCLHQEMNSNDPMMEGRRHRTMLQISFACQLHGVFANLTLVAADAAAISFS